MPLENWGADERVSRGQASERAVCVYEAEGVTPSSAAGRRDLGTVRTRYYNTGWRPVSPVSSRLESKTPWWLVQGHPHLRLSCLKSGVAHEPKPRRAHENDGGKRSQMRVSRPPPSISMSRTHRPMRAIAVPAGSHSVAATEHVDTRASPPPLPTCVSFLSLPCPNVHPSPCPLVLTGHTGFLLVGPR
jgi:hypothetical protein